jgi:CBS domain-containing protein
MKKVYEIMTKNPACCVRETSLQEAAQLMVDHDCGEIPVVNNLEEKNPVGVLTDRDICCRAVAKGLNPVETVVENCMTSPCVTINQNASIDECCELLEKNKIRRIPVIDQKGSCCGIIAQADLADIDAGEIKSSVIKKISKPTDSASQLSN